MTAFDQMAEALNEAENVIRAADNSSTRMANILKGRLRKVKNSWTLADLKRELRAFNIQTGTWKDR